MTFTDCDTSVVLERLADVSSTDVNANSIFLAMTSGYNESNMTTVTFRVDSNVTSEEDLGSDQYKSFLLYKVTEYMSMYYIWMVLAFGLPGNLVSIYTIMTMPIVSSSKAHVAILAVTDTVAIISKLTYFLVSEQGIKLTVPGCALLMFVQQFATVYANWVVVAMTTERFLAVCFPLQVGRMYTRRKALMVLACFALITAAVFLFFFWAWTESYDQDYAGYSCHLKDEYQPFLIGTFYWIEACYSAIIPCLLILVGNALIITNIKRARKAQRHLTNALDQGGRKARDQRQITVMLVLVSVVFLVLNIPLAIFYCIKPFWNRSEPYQEVEHIFTSRFVHVLADANHAVNFYLYFLSMTTFRRRFLDAIGCRARISRRPAGSSVYRTSQTYTHTVHHSSDGDYSAYQRTTTSSKSPDTSHCLKSYISNNDNRAHHSAMTATSQV